MFLKSAKEVKQERKETVEAVRGDELTRDFLQMLDEWHSKPEVKDYKLEAYLLQRESEILLSPIGMKEEDKNYFTPSSANSCPRELFHRLRGDKRDEFDIQPHQGRWKRMGTAFGKMIQRDLLYIHKYYEKKTGKKPPFTPWYNNLFLGGEMRRVPYWEEFAKRSLTLKYKGTEINIQGQPDGILSYKDGSLIGLEIKSKQTSYNRTSEYAMREPDESHKRQVVAYSILYGVEEFIILYGNLAKKAWNMSEEEYFRYPDLRAFYVRVAEEDKKKMLDYFVSIINAVKDNKPPKIDPDKWTFNNYKTACIMSMSKEEIEEIKDEFMKLVNSTRKLDKVPRDLQNRINNLADIISMFNQLREDE